MAPVWAEMSPHTGRRRYRCKTCNKVAYAAEAHARDAAEKVQKANGHTMRAYFNDECSWWHLTSQPLRVRS